MGILYYITSCLFVLWIVRKVIYWVAVWQDCDYNPTNFFNYLLKERRQRSMLASIFVYARLLLLFAYIVIIFTDNLLPLYQIFIFLFFAFQFLLLVREIVLRQVKIPTVTFRSVLLILLSFAVISFLALYPLMERYFWLLLLDLLSPAIITLFVYLSLFPTEIIDDWKIEQAAEKLEEFPNLKVIVVAGDEATAATKDYIGDFLRNKYTVVKTEKSKNYAIIETILTKVKESTEFLVVDIQMKNQEEVKTLASLLNPEIVILTALNNRLRKKKFRELLHSYTLLTDAVSENGFTLFNGNSKNLRSMYNRKRKQKALFIFDPVGSEREKDSNMVIGYRNERERNKLTFGIALRGDILDVALPPISALECVLPAVYIANHFGVPEKEIAVILKRLV